MRTSEGPSAEPAYYWLTIIIVVIKKYGILIPILSRLGIAACVDL
jgi:hypothetical protein